MCVSQMPPIMHDASTIRGGYCMIRYARAPCAEDDVLSHSLSEDERAFLDFVCAAGSGHSDPVLAGSGKDLFPESA